MAGEKTLHVPPRGPLPAATPPTSAELVAGAEVRLRCLEAAAQPALATLRTHEKGYAAGILEAAQQFHTWVTTGRAEGVEKLL